MERIAVPADFAAELRALYAGLDADIAARGPRCEASGRCCRFEQYGHRLYVSSGELAYFASVHEQTPEPAPTGTRRVSLPQFFAAPTTEGCPYQVDKLCTAREARPLGCRLYFCDPSAQSWQNELYEHYHARIKALHEKHGLAYAYLEWRAALKTLL